MFVDFLEEVIYCFLSGLMLLSVSMSFLGASTIYRYIVMDISSRKWGRMVSTPSSRLFERAMALLLIVLCLVSFFCAVSALGVAKDIAREIVGK